MKNENPTQYIPYACQDISDEDIAAVVSVLKSDFLTQGPKIVEFESKLSAYTGAAHAIAVCNATAALHLCCMAFGLKQGDYLWTTPITFVASSNCALHCGASVDFVDINPKTYNLDPIKLAEKLKWAKKNNCLPKVVIPVHLAGQSCDMKAIKALSDEYGFYIIEDASHAIGGDYHDKKVGACEYADASVFSFHAVKVFTTGEGGAITTNNAELVNKLLQLRTCGITRDQTQMEGGSHGAWYYQQLSLGLNYRLNEIQATLGISQFSRLDDFILKREGIVAKYNEQLDKNNLILPYVKPNIRSAWHLYVVKVREDSNVCRKDLFDYLRSKNIGVNVHYIPVHTQPYYQNLGFKSGDFPISEDYYAHAISLPMHTRLSMDEQDYVIKTVNGYFK